MARKTVKKVVPVELYTQYSGFGEDLVSFVLFENTISYLRGIEDFLGEIFLRFPQLETYCEDLIEYFDDSKTLDDESKKTVKYNIVFALALHKNDFEGFLAIAKDRILYKILTKKAQETDDYEKNLDIIFKTKNTVDVLFNQLVTAVKETN